MKTLLVELVFDTQAETPGNRRSSRWFRHRSRDAERSKSTPDPTAVRCDLDIATPAESEVIAIPRTPSNAPGPKSQCAQLPDSRLVRLGARVELVWPRGATSGPCRVGGVAAIPPPLVAMTVEYVTASAELAGLTVLHRDKNSTSSPRSLGSMWSGSPMPSISEDRRSPRIRVVGTSRPVRERPPRARWRPQAPRGRQLLVGARSRRMTRQRSPSKSRSPTGAKPYRS